MQSLNDHCTDFLLDEKVKITKQSFAEKFNNKTVNFLKKVLNTLKINDNKESTIGLLNLFSNVYIQDGTYFKLPLAYIQQYQGMGNSSVAGAKIMFTYDFKNGNFCETELLEGKRNDVKSANNCEWISKNSLIIRDLGFFSLESLKEIEEKEAYFITKLKPRTSIYQKTGNKYALIEVKKLVNHMKNNNIKTLITKIHIGNKKQIETNAVIQLQPEHIVNERIRTKKKKGELRNWNMSEEYIYWAHLNIYITNLKSEYLNIREIVNIYRIRWQIELMFKTWKSHHKIHQYKFLNNERFQCYIYASLIGLMCHYKIYHYYKIHCLKMDNKIISLLKISKVLIQVKRELKLIFNSPQKCVLNIINLLNEIKKEIFIETKTGQINQYIILKIK